MATPTLKRDEAEGQKEEPVWCQKDDRLLERIRSAAMAQARLEEELKYARTMLDEYPGFKSSLSALAKAEKAASEVTQALRRCEAEAENAWKPTEKSATKAAEVFGIPELMEQILSHLPSRDLLSATQVQRTMAAAVNSSIMLQQKLGLIPMKDGFWKGSPFQDWPTASLRCHVTEPGDSWREDSHPDSVEINLGFLGHRLPKIGTRCRQMFVTQPAICEMDVDIRCCGKDGPRDWGFNSPGRAAYSAPILPLRADGGVTMGHVYDTAAKLMAEHRLCPYADAFSLDGNGVAAVVPRFSAIVRLQHEDPFLVQHRESESEAASEQQYGQDVSEARMWRMAYASAKREAFNAGRRIPTLAEYEASTTQTRDGTENLEGSGESCAEASEVDHTG